MLLAPEEAGRCWRGGRIGCRWNRLDGAFDHWLLDEFQDTSGAVACGGELVDEAVQDPDRSFFCVGEEAIHLRLAWW